MSTSCARVLIVAGSSRIFFGLIMLGREIFVFAFGLNLLFALSSLEVSQMLLRRLVVRLFKVLEAVHDVVLGLVYVCALVVVT